VRGLVTLGRFGADYVSGTSMRALHATRPPVLPLLLLASLPLPFALPAWADLVHLKNGRVLSGEVIEDDGKTIVVRVPNGTIKLRAEQVEYVEKQTSLEYRVSLAREQMARQRYDLARESLGQAGAARPDKPEARKALAAAYAEYAERLRRARRFTEAQAAYRKWLDLEPDSAQAREALGGLAADHDELEKLLAQARAAAAAQDPGGAIEKFEAALRFSPDTLARAGAEIALCYARRAESSFREKRYESSAADLERAFSLDPGLANKLENLYAASALPPIVARAAAGQLEGARKDAARVLVLAPTHRAALYVAGRIEEDLKSPGTAVAYFARALKASPGQATAERAAELRGQLERALGIQGAGIRFNLQPVDEAVYTKAEAGDFLTLDQEPFLIHHHNEALANEAARVLGAHLDRIQELTGLRADWRKERVKVFIHRTQEEYVAATNQEAWSGGMSRFARVPGQGLMRMEIHSWQTSPRLLKSVIPHELMHLIVNSNLSAYEDLPRALHEGFSVLMEPGYRQTFYLNFLRMRLKSESFIPLSELLAMKKYPGDEEFFYAEGYALVAYLVQTAGFEKAIGLIRRAPKEPFEARLLALTGQRSLERLEDDWKDWVQKNGK
jgi:tetratricopeptide (TPR) repeat protein